MTNDEINNCRFEPNAGRMSSYYNLKITDDRDEYSWKNFMVKHGKNLENSHPEIYKRGILKRATREYNEGDFNTAYNTLAEGFNIVAIQNKFDPEWKKRKEEKKKSSSL